MTRSTSFLSSVLAGTVLAAALTACGAGPAPPTVTAGPVAVTSAAPAPAPVLDCSGAPISGAPVEIATRLGGGRAEPAPQRVEVALGTTVVVRAEADQPAEIHLHGYDVLAEAAPGRPACLRFVADQPGLFELEAHPAVLLVQLAVR